jgi:dephospho-CoA kinase
MRVIGLTGGIGSGKSSAARFFSELNVRVIDADHIAKDLLAENDLAQQVIDHFGQQICDKNGQLQRHLLRDLIFSDAAARVWLENLLHPLIRSRIIAAIAQSESAYVVVVIPLLVETHQEDYIDRVLVIDVPESVQVNRLMQRDGMSMVEANKILQIQASRQTRLAFADDVIENTGSLQELKDKIRNLHAYYLQLSL